MASTTSPRPATPGRGDRAAAEAPPAWELAARDFSDWRAGDPAGLRRLVEALTPVLWHTARAYGLNREAADDVVQATWLALVRGADSLRDPQAVWRWATVTARREAWRAARRDRREATTDDQHLDAAAPPSAGPENAVLADASAAALWRHVAGLTARCRRLLRVIAFDDRPDYASISAELGMPVGSIGPTRGRCLEKLRHLLADDPQWRVS
ncbi:DNA-directed RNA polymerase sigma-70 factor [Pilimelia terevasa]|uniref:DNA-directed RNA polymerase sigma-70 factor n=1 Tax=Pilimelia terevasa TaxID=53372 RepID=A0A8J3FHH6_9ACTN|nr:sigma-70 family RNA polymerase sigma factor [Pilimelia terevasa]GGK28723.1 DNA-directed RNA polymerase sigma-70 factor [Pilimelia terevasa]